MLQDSSIPMQSLYIAMCVSPWCLLNWLASFLHIYQISSWWDRLREEADWGAVEQWVLLLSRSWGLPWSRWPGASVSPASHLWGRSKISFKNVWTMLKGLFKNFQQSGSFKICWPNPQEWPLWFCLQWGSYPRWIIPHFLLKIKDGKELGCIKWIGTITKLPHPSTPRTRQAHSSLSAFALRTSPSTQPAPHFPRSSKADSFCHFGLAPMSHLQERLPHKPS